MSRELDKKIAAWLGWKQVQAAITPSTELWYADPECANPTVRFPLPHFSSFDTAAISLLPIAVARGFLPYMDYSQGCWHCGWLVEDAFVEGSGSTIAAAISEAVLQLIESEAKQ